MKMSLSFSHVFEFVFPSVSWSIGGFESLLQKLLIWSVVLQWKLLFDKSFFWLKCFKWISWKIFSLFLFKFWFVERFVSSVSCSCCCLLAETCWNLWGQWGFLSKETGVLNRWTCVKVKWTDCFIFSSCLFSLKLCKLSFCSGRKSENVAFKLLNMKVMFSASSVEAGLHHDAGLAEVDAELQLGCGLSQSLQVLQGLPVQVLVHLDWRDDTDRKS